jgi:hypothetical protein
MKNIVKLISTVIVVLATQTVFGDSPLSQTKFFTAYYLNENVQYAEQTGILDGRLAGYLVEESVPAELKAAVINALRWDVKGKNNISTFEMFLGRKYGKSFEKLNEMELTGDELFCLGYLVLMDQKGDLNRAVRLLEKAKAKNSSSYTVNLIYNLATAQKYLKSSDKCNAWKACDAVRNDSSLKQDFSNEASRMIFDEVDKLKDSCN